MFDDSGDVVSYSGNPILLDSSVAEGKVKAGAKDCIFRL